MSYSFLMSCLFEHPDQTDIGAKLGRGYPLFQPIADGEVLGYFNFGNSREA